MLPTAMPSLIARFTRRRQRTGRPQEPADMGTAFGMEQWLDEQDRQAPPVVRPPSLPRSWLSRWLDATTLRRSRF